MKKLVHPQNDMNVNKNDTDLDGSWLTILCLLAHMHENGADLSKIMKLDTPFPSCDFLPSILLTCCDDHGIF